MKIIWVLHSILFVIDCEDHVENPATEVHAGVPLIAFQERTEDDEIERLLQEFIAEEDGQTSTQQPPPVDPVRWPTQDLNPVNEYTTEGYIAMAFPTLMPYGGADLRDQSRREAEVKCAEYFDALLCYKDGRFGSHPRYNLHTMTEYLIHRFPFFALNTKLRSQAQSQAKLYIRTYPGVADLTIDDLRRKLESNEKHTLIQSIQRSIDWIPGLSPFWNRHRLQLTNMIDQLGSPHLFFTLSAADLHWPELHRLIEEQRAQFTGDPLVNLDQMNERAAYDRRIDNLSRFPHIVASFLQSRIKAFLESLKQIPEFDYVDYWYRYEWQHRGSGHVHGFLWLKDGPVLDDKDLDNPEHRADLAQYFAKRVFSHTPIPNHPRPAVNPCQVSAPVDKDNRTDVAELLNRCQRHAKCLPSYCLRWNRQLKKLACRFGFLQLSCDGPKIEKNHKGQWTYYPFRPNGDNDLNRYHPLWTAMWRGNVDLSPVLGKHAAINYIAKYAAKAESMSTGLDKTILDLTQDQPDTDGIGTIIAKTLNKFCIERDFSAQEACHQLLQLPMVECSRIFVTINLPADLTVNRILNPRRRRRPQAQSNAAQRPGMAYSWFVDS